MTKKELLQSVIDTLKKNMESAEERLKTIVQAAVDAPGAMQSYSDTTKSQMGQIADELQRSLTEQSLTLGILQSMVSSYSLFDDVGCVKIGSFVEVLDENTEREFYLILPAGGGIEISDQGREILVISSHAPIATALIGKKPGEKIGLKIGQLQRNLTIVNIQ